MNESIFEKGLPGVPGIIDEADPKELHVPGADDDDPGAVHELISIMKGLMSDSDDDDDDDDDGVDCNTCHNRAVAYANNRRYRKAAEICMKGLKKFPFNVDLLADTIEYSTDVGDMQTAAAHYSILKEKVPFQRWNWRAFTFSIDHLLSDDPIANERECRTLIDHFRKYIPYDERAYLALSELEAALGNTQASMHALEEAVHTFTNARMCALRLADMQLDRGLYEDVLVTTDYAIAASAEVQPSISIPYLFYIRTLAKDHLLHKEACSGKPVSREALEALKGEYVLLLREFSGLMDHARAIKLRMKMLAFVKTE